MNAREDEGEETTGFHPSRVLAALVEPWGRGRRVAVVGDALSGLAEAIAERGARFVQVLDPDGGRVAGATARTEAGSRVAFAVLPGPANDLSAQREGFDVVIATDLGTFEDPKGECARLRRLLSPGGIFVAATPNRDATVRLAAVPTGSARKVDYYELYDALSPLFRNVRTFGQAPFVGYAVADFAADAEPEVAVDTSLATGPDEPEWFVAAASDRAIAGVGEFSLIGLPVDGASLGGALPAKPEDDRVALAEAHARIAALSSQLDAARDRERAKGRELEQRTAELGAAAAQLEDARRDSRGAKHEAEAQRLAAERDRAKSRLEEIERELAKARADLASAVASGATRVRALERSAAAEREKAAAEREAAEAAQARASELEAELQAVSARPAPEEEDPSADVEALEAQLRERGQTIVQLGRDLREAERFARELLGELEAARGAPPPAGSDDAVRAAELAARLDALASDAARREADYQAAGWRVRSLEREIAELRQRAESAARAATEEAVLLAQASGAVGEGP